MSYKKWGVKERIRKFFEINPVEELTLDQMVIKFDSTPDSVKRAIVDLKAEGFVERAIVFRKVSKNETCV